MTKPFTYFDDICWPVPGDGMDALEYALRHAQKGTIFSMEDRLIAASAIAAYRALVLTDSARRAVIIRELHKGISE